MAESVVLLVLAMLEFPLVAAVDTVWFNPLIR